MNTTVIEKTIVINALPEQVWRVFTDAAVTRQIGGEYVSDWKAGSPFGWKGLDGKTYTRGIILELKIEELLKHNLFKDDNSVISVITYRLEPGNGHTTLFAREELVDLLTGKAYEEVVEGWDAALFAVKQAAENIS